MAKKTTYYLIWKRVLGKRTDKGDFIYKDGKWKPDKDSMIMDRLMGYDPTEPPGSPYAMMDSSIMDEIEEISEEKAKEFLKTNKI